MRKTKCLPLIVEQQTEGSVSNLEELCRVRSPRGFWAGLPSVLQEANDKDRLAQLSELPKEQIYIHNSKEI